MMTGYSRRRGLVLAALALTMSVAACNAERTDVFRPTGQQAINFVLGLSGTNIPRGTSQYVRAASSANDSMVVILRGLEPLPNAYYKAWLGTVNASFELTNVVPAVGRIRVFRTDSTLDANGDLIVTRVLERGDTIAGAATFQDGGPRHEIDLRLDSARYVNRDLRQFNVLLVTLETDAAATAPSDLRPLFARYVTTAGATTVVRFGNFHPRAESTYVFVPSGRGMVGVLGNVLIVDDSALSRPPRGYYYATHVVRRDSATNNVIDTIFLGPQTAPFPRRSVSLFDADVSLVDPVVQANPPSILAAAARVRSDTSAFGSGTRPFRNAAQILVTLENKLGSDNIVSPAIILSSTVPNAIRF